MGEERTAVDLLRAWCAALSNLDAAGQVALLADDAVLRAPYAPEGVPPRVEGRAEIAPLLGFVANLFSAYRLTSTAFHATDDPDLAVGTAHADITLSNGQPYTQDLVFFVRARDGLIAEYTEYLDPIRAQAALGATA
jgi:ketosteroid isomerase-like protein